MTWLHCSVFDDSIVAMTYDDEWNPNNLTPGMESFYYYVMVDETPDTLRHLMQPVPDTEGLGDDKHAGKMNFNKAVPLRDRANVRDGRKRMKPMKDRVRLRDITVRRKPANA